MFSHDSTTQELDAVLAPLTPEELKMDGGSSWENVAARGLGTAGAAGAVVDSLWENSPAWLGPVSTGLGVASAVWGAFLIF
jgi:hypothetical protein